MNNTIQITIASDDEQLREQLIAHLSAIDFDGFEEKDNELIAFINEKNLDIDSLDKILSVYNVKYSSKIIEEQNWNALWESNFQHVIVDDFCAVRAHFHPPVTQTKFEIIITPKMSFGTGHHATTYMMISQMSRIDFKDKRVADFGTGTGVLAILAEKLGSKYVWAIDHDEWSIENATENIEKNGCQHVIIEKKEGFLTSEKFDIILANINKNVILSNLDRLLSGIQGKGVILLSGLLTDDEADIVSAFEAKGCKHVSTVEKNKWISILLEY